MAGWILSLTSVCDQTRSSLLDSCHTKRRILTGHGQTRLRVTRQLHLHSRIADPPRPLTNLIPQVKCNARAWTYLEVPVQCLVGLPTSHRDWTLTTHDSPASSALRCHRTSQSSRSLVLHHLRRRRQATCRSSSYALVFSSSASTRPDVKADTLTSRTCRARCSM